MIVQKLQVDRQKIQERLAAQDVSMSELAKALDVSYERLRNWTYYYGKHPVPWRMALRLASALGCTPADLGTVVQGEGRGRPTKPVRPDVVATLRARVAGGAQ